MVVFLHYLLGLSNTGYSSTILSNLRRPIHLPNYLHFFTLCFPSSICTYSWPVWFASTLRWVSIWVPFNSASHPATFHLPNYLHFTLCFNSFICACSRSVRLASALSLRWISIWVPPFSVYALFVLPSFFFGLIGLDLWDDWIDLAVLPWNASWFFVCWFMRCWFDTVLFDFLRIFFSWLC